MIIVKKAKTLSELFFRGDFNKIRERALVLLGAQRQKSRKNATNTQRHAASKNAIAPSAQTQQPEAMNPAQIEILDGYIDGVFDAVSKYDSLATQFGALWNATLSARIYFNGYPSEKDFHEVKDGDLEATIAATHGKVELKIFVDPQSDIKNNKSFALCVFALDSDGRQLEISELTRSRDPELGHYVHIAADPEGEFSVSFTVPFAAKMLKIKVTKFGGKDDHLVLEPSFQIVPARLSELSKEFKSARAELIGKLRAVRSKRNADKKSAYKPFLYIMDEFTEKCITSTANGFPLSRDNFRTQIETSITDVLILESFWRGNNGRWIGAMTYDNPLNSQRLALEDAIETAKESNKKIVFYNKEDPMHFDRFLPFAERSDIVFTSDSDCVTKYQKILPGKPIHVLKFAAPTKLCNPSGMTAFEDRDSVAFAGGYYGVNHDARVEQMDYILPAIAEFNGVIFDRHSANEAERYRYPNKYQRFCRDSIPYKKMVEEYRNFKAFLNVNTITNSSTMMSRRVYELLACGTPVVTSPSRAILDQFGDTVSIVETEADAKAAVQKLVHDKLHWMRRSHQGYRHVMNGETYEDRVQQIMETIYPGLQQGDVTPFVSMITPTKEPGDYVRIIENALSQSHPRLELIVGFGYHYSESDVADFLQRLQEGMQKANKSIHLRYIHFREKVSLGYKLNCLIHEASGEFIAKMDDDDFYGPNYISDMLLPIKWGKYDLIGKRGTFWHDVATGKFYFKHPAAYHRPSDFIFGATFLGRRTMFLQNPFQERSTGEDTFQLLRLKSKGYKIYASDPFNFCYLRRTSQHTWNVPTDFWQEDCEELPEGTRLSDFSV